jgi:hypothetical protein
MTMVINFTKIVSVSKMFLLLFDLSQE